MDDTAALQECVDLSLEIDEFSPATQMFLSSSPSLQNSSWISQTPVLRSASESEQPQLLDLQQLGPQTQNSTSCRLSQERGSSRLTQCVQPVKSASKKRFSRGIAHDRGKAPSASKSPSNAAKLKLLAVPSSEHRDSAEFFERHNGGLLSPDPVFSSADFALLPADDASNLAPSVPSSTSICTPKKIEAKSTAYNSKLLRPSPNVSLFSGSKSKNRTDSGSGSSPRALSKPACDAVPCAVDLAAALQIGAGKPVPAPPIPLICTQDTSCAVSAVHAADADFLQIQHFLSSRC
jgi:hypothetical protein